MHYSIDTGAERKLQSENTTQNQCNSPQCEMGSYKTSLPQNDTNDINKSPSGDNKDVELLSSQMHPSDLQSSDVDAPPRVHSLSAALME